MAAEDVKVNNEQLLPKPWHIAHPNVLIEGSELAIDTAIDDLRQWLSGPVYMCSLPGPLVLPTVVTGALLLRDVGALAPVQQDALLRWMEVPTRRVQVVTATSTRLFSRVEDGTFRESLYYLLNIVLEYMDPPRPSSALR